MHREPTRIREAGVHNYFITYDIRRDYTPQEYPRVEQAIRRVDPHAVRVLYSVWYLKSAGTPLAIHDAIRPALDNNDGLLVIRASDAAWSVLLTGAQEVVQQSWHATGSINYSL